MSVLFVLNNHVTVNAVAERKQARGLSKLFPNPTFDMQSPYCTEREPCGFYSFSLTSRFPLKWVNSWCQCNPDSECVYDRTDLKMRVYRLACVLKDEYVEANAVEALIADHRNLPPGEKLQIAESLGISPTELRRRRMSENPKFN
ncbi:hypothetical protein M3Y95_01179800 [Aphelenchoides besseyi]|nr:hypothetical protein M3Y95_01179800 [Aphelenchoides besseyi]